MHAPYMPDSARASMPPRSPIQPLPAYLRPDFAQSLDHERGPELLDVDEWGRPYPLPANRRHCLRYRYSDTGETVTVPNCWYNQLRSTRVDAWRWELSIVDARIASLQAERQALLDKPSTGPRTAELRELGYRIESAEKVRQSVQKTLADVMDGKILR